jgi:hypothetical protein
MIRKLFAPLPTATIFLLAAGTAAAASRHLEATGGRFAVDSSCARHVSIQPNASVVGRVVVDATADNQDELDQLALESGPAAKLHVPSDHCWRDDAGAAFTRTLNITVQVPAGFDISVDEGGGVIYDIGGVGGALVLDLSGGVTLKADRASALTVDLSAGGQANIASVNGPVKAVISGGGFIGIISATASTLGLELSGGGTFTVGQGSIDKLAVDISGGGRAHIGATVRDAAFDVSGGGSVSVTKVTGTVHKDISGAGSVTIARQ